MQKLRRVFLVSGLLLAFPMLTLAAQDQGCNGTRLQVDLTTVGGSGVTGTATICVGEDGLRGKLNAQNLTVGHGYTVWLFYIEGTDVGGPGRFDSLVAEASDETFHGHVGGLQVSSGATVRLVLLNHPDLGSDNVTRANNLLTPTGGTAVAKAVFSIP